MVLRKPPVGETQANGAVENAIRRDQGQITRVQMATDDALKSKIETDLSIWQRLVERSASTFNRHKAGQDGTNPYKKIKGGDSAVAIAACGENVYYHLSKKQMSKKDKITPTWKEGIFLRLLCTSNEYIIGTNCGVIKAHSIKTMPDAICWDTGMFREMQGIPWKQVPHKNDTRIPTHISDEDESGDESNAEIGDAEGIAGNVVDDEQTEVAAPIRYPEPNARAFAARRKDITRYGAIDKCRGCTATARDWKISFAHSLACRDRIMKQMGIVHACESLRIVVYVHACESLRIVVYV